MLILLLEIRHLRFITLFSFFIVYLIVTLSSSPNSNSLLSVLLLFIIFLSCAFVGTSSLFVLFITYELSLYPVSLIILMFGYQPEKIKSLLYILLYTVVCSVPFLWFTIRHSGIVTSIFQGLPQVACSLICLSFLVKSPLFILHSWLPIAHVEAPLIGSILLAGVILKFGAYGTLLLSPSLHFTFSIFVYLSLTGGVICSVICCRNWDLKSLVAYSSVVHIGVVTICAFSCIETGYLAAVGILVRHSLISPLLFVLAYEVYINTGRRAFILGHTCTLSSGLLVLFAICAGINFGLPPFLSFWVEVALYTSQGDLWLVSTLPLMVCSFFTFLYSVFFYILSLGGSYSPSLRLPTHIFLFLAPIILCLFLGLFGGF